MILHHDNKNTNNITMSYQQEVAEKKSALLPQGLIAERHGHSPNNLIRSKQLPKIKP
jgi:hypothetical protein